MWLNEMMVSSSSPTTAIMAVLDRLDRMEVHTTQPTKGYKHGKTSTVQAT